MEQNSKSTNRDLQVFGILHHQVLEIHHRWAIFKALFYTTEGRIELISTGMGVLFERLFNDLLDNTNLAIARLTDSQKQGSYNNLVLGQLIGKIVQNDNETLSVQQKRVEDAIKKIRIRRNKILAHSDLETYLRPIDSVNVDISFDNIEDALIEIREFMNLCATGFGIDNTAYDAIFTVSVERLLTQLAKAAEYDEMVDEGLIPPARILTRLQTISEGERELYQPRH